MAEALSLMESYGRDCQPIENLSELNSKKKIVFLLPSLSKWWNTRSKQLLEKHLEDLMTDAINLSKTTNSVLGKFILINGLDFEKKMEELLHRIKFRLMDDGRVGLFAVRISTTREQKSKISIPLFRIDEEQNIKKDDCASLFPAKNIHGMAILKIVGLKITKSTVNFDLQFMNLFQKRITQGEFIEETD